MCQAHRVSLSNVFTMQLYEDLDGMVLPPSLASMGEVCWKRPTEYGPEVMHTV